MSASSVLQLQVLIHQFFLVSHNLKKVSLLLCALLQDYYVGVKKQKSKPNLYLVGFMGVGKSLLGRRVARALNYNFIDSDHAIEKKEGRRIPEIFAAEGEAYFRQLERAFIEVGHAEEGSVVSCGGGLVIEPGMSELLKSKGVVICLFASIESILERTQYNSNRPLLQVEDPEARIRELLAKREPIYMNSGACITTEGRTIPEVVRHILRTYRECKRQDS